MAALTNDRATPEAGTEVFEFPQAAGVFIFRGAMVGLDAQGLLHPAGSAPSLTIMGRAETGTADWFPQAAITPGSLPTGTVIAEGTPLIRVKRGRVYSWNNSAGADLVGPGSIGQPCYAVDDNTVALTNGGTTPPRAVAGTVRNVDATGVWVQPL